MKRMLELAVAVYRDYTALRGGPLRYVVLEEVVGSVLREPPSPMRYPNAQVTAARLLHGLLTERRHLPLNSGAAWALVETYLLLHGLRVTLSDDEALDLIEAIRGGELSRSSTPPQLATDGTIGWGDSR